MGPKRVALSNAERQRRWREKRAHGEPVVRYQTVQTRPVSRPRRWAAAVQTLRDLQGEYQAWLDALPESLHDSPTGQRLQEICELDVEEFDVEPPRGFGRD